MKDIGYGCSCLIFLICHLVLIWFVILFGFILYLEIHYYLKNGHWQDHGSLLETMEADGELVFTEWKGVRKILSHIPRWPWLEILLLGCLVCVPLYLLAMWFDWILEKFT